MRTRPGFTIVEILVVVALVMLLAQLGAINILRNRITGNETVALADVRQVAVALQMYHSVNNAYPDPLGLLSDAMPAYLTDSLTGGSGQNGNPNLHGYAYTYTREDNFNYTVIARPTTQGATGVRRFFVDETGALRYTSDGTDPTASSPLIQ